MLNGKPLNENENSDVSVRRMKIKDLNNFSFSPADGSFGPMERQIKIAGLPNKAMLGVTTEKADAGAVVRSVNEESAAEKAGIKEGDIITEVDNKKIETPAELSEALKDKKPGDKVSIGYLRDGKKEIAHTELTAWKAPQTMTFNAQPNFEFNDIFENLSKGGGQGNRNFYFREAPAFGLAASSGPKLGIKIQDVETGTGVKVIEIEKGSDADKAGLREGDIIREANSVSLNSTDDLLVQKRKTRAGSTMKLKIDRNGRSQNIDIVFSKKIKTADL